MQFWSFNFLPYEKVLDVIKLKVFADDKQNVAHTMISIFDRVENIVGKGENAHERVNKQTLIKKQNVFVKH